MNLKSGKKGKAWKDKKQPEPRPSNDGEFLIRPPALSDERIDQIAEVAEHNPTRSAIRGAIKVALSEATTPNAVLVDRYREALEKIRGATFKLAPKSLRRVEVAYEIAEQALQSGESKEKGI